MLYIFVMYVSQSVFASTKLVMGLAPWVLTPVTQVTPTLDTP